MTDAHTRVKRGQSLTCGRIHAAGGHVASLRSAGRHKWRPHGFAARFWRRGDIHVARMTDAYMWRVKRKQSLTRGRTHTAGGHVASLRGRGAVRRRDDARPCRARWAPGVTSGAPTGSRARFWRRGDIHVARMTDAYTRRVKRKQSLTRGGRSCCLPTVGRASQVAPLRIRVRGSSAVGQGRRTRP